MFFKRYGKCIMAEMDWMNLKCKDCGGKMKVIKDNEFESVKVCQECGYKALLLKKIRKELE